VDNKTSIPYIVYEGEMARAERNFKRMWVVVIVLILLLVATNAGWLAYESQFETVETTTVTQENDNGYNNYIGNDGDIVYGEANGNQDENESEENQPECTVQAMPDM
jgi:hypothetical protein